MFRRLWAGLPEAPKFPTDLEKLGYFVNKDDEIRNVKDPKYYFKYFINRNLYWNDCQRFSLNIAVQRIVLARLETLGLRLVRLPLGATATEPHVCVLATDDLATARRVVLFVGETNQDLGILAHRVCSGVGGINSGSLVPMVARIRGEGLNGDGANTKANTDKPAILVFNPGELFWWPEGGRSLSHPQVQGMPRPSAAHLPPRLVPGQNTIPGNEDAERHVASVFRELLDPLCRRQESDGGSSGSSDGSTAYRHASTSLPRFTAISLAGGADALENFFDDSERWERWGPHMDSLVVLGGLHEDVDITTPAFRAFRRERARAYIASEAPVDTPLANSEGNANTKRNICYGCPVYSSGTSWLTELMFLDAQKAILEWGEMVARNPWYTNLDVTVTYAEDVPKPEDRTWANLKEGMGATWEDAEAKPEDEGETV